MTKKLNKIDFLLLFFNLWRFICKITYLQTDQTDSIKFSEVHKDNFTTQITFCLNCNFFIKKWFANKLWIHSKIGKILQISEHYFSRKLLFLQ